LWAGQLGFGGVTDMRFFIIYYNNKLGFVGEMDIRFCRGDRSPGRPCRNYDIAFYFNV